MTQTGPSTRGQAVESFRSARARRLNQGGLHLMVAALVLAAFVGCTLLGSGGEATPFHIGALALVVVLAIVAFLCLIVARRFERADRAEAVAVVRRTVAAAYREAAPRVPVGLVQPVRSGPSSARP